jgi:hypothetical protein
MKTTLTNKEQTQKIDQFIQLYTQGVEAWVKAGEIIVELVEADPFIFDYIIQKCPHLNAGVLGKFEKMGRKIIHPHLLLSNSPGAERLAKMPYSVQQRFIDEPIPLIIHSDQGTDVLLVKAKDLTAAQANQVFTNDRMRTEGEQKAWMVDQQSKAAVVNVKAHVSPWSIKNGRVVFQQGASLSAGELATIITQLTK